MIFIHPLGAKIDQHYMWKYSYTPKSFAFLEGSQASPILPLVKAVS